MLFAMVAYIASRAPNAESNKRKRTTRIIRVPWMLFGFVSITTRQEMQRSKPFFVVDFFRHETFGVAGRSPARGRVARKVHYLSDGAF